MVELNLRGRVALVTGDESGIGSVCVAAMAAAGADVAAIYFKSKQVGKASCSLGISTV